MLELPDDGELILGRAVEASPLADDPEVSRRHARIVRDAAGRPVVEDLGSANGTFVNGAPVTSGRVLRPGDRLTLGGSVLLVEADVAASGPETAIRPPAEPLADAGASPDDEYALGYQALEAGEDAAAAAAFERALQADPGHANSMYQLGVVAQRRGDLEAAATLYHRAIEANPRHVSAHARLQELERLAAAPPPQVLAAAPPAEQPRPAGPPLALDPSGRGVWGRAFAVQQRYEQDQMRRPVMVVTFRLQRGDVDEPQPPVPVELRGPRLKGSLNEGDVVEMPRVWRVGRRAGSVLNLTTGERVRLGGGMAGGLRTLQVVVVCLLAIFVIAMFVAVGSAILAEDPFSNAR
ncbi:MAG: FHA domain-containing protein [Actinomycetota bacterium]|nr:FHA domain-containing protein [Actinomycetota bacterium]